MSHIHKLLIANRGEIAVRIIHTCHAMGIETVAVYSDFDRNALHVQLAGESVPIGPAPARDSYLNIPAIIAAARRVKADAIHPGYGFLAENPGFAAACEQAGIDFIGPRSDVIRAMGSKIEARKLAEEAGVPVVPAATEKEISKLGFPVLIKASAGGGGRGMRIVRSASEFPHALEAARGEAQRAFGDGSLLLEKYIEGARHIEIQIVGDHHGNLMHLFERDCSIQRRHQKIIEESPSPDLTPDLRSRMAEAALALARRLGYTNAGTVEFLLAPSGDFYFIEVNTRIQVEHPVTEMLTGLDLVRLQIEIAQGHRLPSEQPQQVGHAIEARLYAEDPANNFLPSTGTLHVWEPPAGGSVASVAPLPSAVRSLDSGVEGETRVAPPPSAVLCLEGIRIDSGVEEGTEIGVYYDPLLAKIIAHGPDRPTALRKLVFALKNFAAQGVETNREFLINVLEHEEFVAGRAHTGFELPQPIKSDDALNARLATIVRGYIEHIECTNRQVLPTIPIGYRNNPYPSPPIKFAINGREYQAQPQEPGVEILGVHESSVEALIDGVRRRFRIRRHGEQYYLRSNSLQRTVTRLPRHPRRAGGGAQESANSPMPGQVLRVLVSEGQKVKPGEPLVALEAMKMEQTIKATTSGVVQTIRVKPGQVVAPGEMLVEIQSMEDANEHANRSAANND